MSAARKLFEDSFGLLGKRATIATRYRVPMTVAGHLFPMQLRTADDPEPELPDTVQGLPEQCYRDLPFAILKNTVTRRELYDAFYASLHVIGKLRGDLVTLIGAICKSNTIVKTQWTKDQQLHDQMMERIKRLIARLPDLTFRMPDVLTPKLHKNPSDAAVRLTLEYELRSECHKALKEFFHCLDMMVDEELVGVITWDGNDSCQFHFFTNNVEEKVTDKTVKRKEEKRRTEKEELKIVSQETEVNLETTYSHSRHIHEVVCADKLTLEAAEIRGVPRPPRIQELLTTLSHSPLRDFIHMVVGQEIGRGIVTRDLEIEHGTDRRSEEIERTTIQRVYNFDPAITLSFYVLSGWSEDEVRPPTDPPLALHAPTKLKVITQE